MMSRTHSHDCARPFSRLQKVWHLVAAGNDVCVPDLRTESVAMAPARWAASRSGIPRPRK